MLFLRGFSRSFLKNGLKLITGSLVFDFDGGLVKLAIRHAQSYGRRHQYQFSRCPSDSSCDVSVVKLGKSTTESFRWFSLMCLVMFLCHDCMFSSGTNDVSMVLMKSNTNNARVASTLPKNLTILIVFFFFFL